MAPELESCLAQVEASNRIVEELVLPLTKSQLEWQPKPGVWSIGQCLEHLNMTLEQFLPAVDLAMEKGRKAGKLSPGPFRHGWLMRKFLASMEPPVKTKMRAAKVIQPAPEVNKEPLLQEFRDWREQLRQRIVAADGLDLKKIKVQSPFLRLLWWDLGTAIQVMAAHDRRHLWQAEQVRKEAAFPMVKEASRTQAAAG